MSDQPSNKEVKKEQKKETKKWSVPKRNQSREKPSSTNQAGNDFDASRIARKYKMKKPDSKNKIKLNHGQEARNGANQSINTESKYTKALVSFYKASSASYRDKQLENSLLWNQTNPKKSTKKQEDDNCPQPAPRNGLPEPHRCDLFGSSSKERQRNGIKMMSLSPKEAQATFKAFKFSPKSHLTLERASEEKDPIVQRKMIRMLLRVSPPEDSLELKLAKELLRRLEIYRVLKGLKEMTDQRKKKANEKLQKKFNGTVLAIEFLHGHRLKKKALESLKTDFKKEKGLKKLQAKRKQAAFSFLRLGTALQKQKTQDKEIIECFRRNRMGKGLLKGLVLNIYGSKSKKEAESFHAFWLKRKAFSVLMSTDIERLKGALCPHVKRDSVYMNRLIFRKVYKEKIAEELFSWLKLNLEEKKEEKKKRKQRNEKTKKKIERKRASLFLKRWIQAKNTRKGLRKLHRAFIEMTSGHSWSFLTQNLLEKRRLSALKFIAFSHHRESLSKKAFFSLKRVRAIGRGAFLMEIQLELLLSRYALMRWKYEALRCLCGTQSILISRIKSHFKAWSDLSFEKNVILPDKWKTKRLLSKSLNALSFYHLKRLKRHLALEKSMAFSKHLAQKMLRRCFVEFILNQKEGKMAKELLAKIPSSFEENSEEISKSEEEEERSTPSERKTRKKGEIILGDSLQKSSGTDSERSDRQETLKKRKTSQNPSHSRICERKTYRVSVRNEEDSESISEESQEDHYEKETPLSSLRDSFSFGSGSIMSPEQNGLGMTPETRSNMKTLGNPHGYSASSLAVLQSLYEDTLSFYKSTISPEFKN